MQLGRGGFTSSAKAELFAYRRRRKGRIKVCLKLNAQSKRRLHTQSPDRQFISGVEKALKGQGRIRRSGCRSRSKCIFTWA